MTKVVELNEINKNLLLESIDGETWADIEGSFKGCYQVSNFGRVKNLGRRVIAPIQNGSIMLKEKIRVLYINKNGYCVVNLSVQNKTKTFQVHRLVALSFIPNPENKPCVNHIDGNPLNNCYWNLEWCTHSENSQHAYKTGLMNIPVGEKAYNSKLTLLEVKEIKNLASLGVKQLVLSSKFGVNQSTISRICNEKRWKVALIQ